MSKYYEVEAYVTHNTGVSSAGVLPTSAFGPDVAQLHQPQDEVASHLVGPLLHTDADPAAVGYYNNVADNNTPLSARNDGCPVRVLVDSASPFVEGSPGTFSGAVTGVTSSDPDLVIHVESSINTATSFTLDFNGTSTVYETITAYNAGAPSVSAVEPDNTGVYALTAGVQTITVSGGVADTGGLVGSTLDVQFANTSGDRAAFGALSGNVTAPLSSGSGQVTFDKAHIGQTAALILQDRSSFEFEVPNATGVVTLTSVGHKDFGPRERRLRNSDHF